MIEEMESQQLKAEIQAILEHADERLLRMIHAICIVYQQESDKEQGKADASK
jgi:hypothetical protein